MSPTNNPAKSEIQVEEIENLSPSQKCEYIADEFAKISQFYDNLQASNMSLNGAPDKQLPSVEPWDIYRFICQAKTSSSTVHGDIPMKLIKEVGIYLSEPLSDTVAA